MYCGSPNKLSIYLYIEKLILHFLIHLHIICYAITGNLQENVCLIKIFYIKKNLKRTIYEITVQNLYNATHTKKMFRLNLFYELKYKNLHIRTWHLILNLILWCLWLEQSSVKIDVLFTVPYKYLDIIISIYKYLKIKYNQNCLWITYMKLN